MFTAQRFFAFLSRFWPLWAVGLVVLALPATREVWHLHTVGSPLFPLYEQPWRLSFGRDKEFDALERAGNHPKDLNAQLWRIARLLNGPLEDEEDTPPPEPSDLLQGAKTIRDQFPEQKWLVVLPVKIIEERMDVWHLPQTTGNLPKIPLKMARELTSYIRQGARLEPQNAYYPFVEAKLGRLSGDEAAVWAALIRASECAVFDNHQLEFANSVVAAHEAIRPLGLEEKDYVWRLHYQSLNRDDNRLVGLLKEQGYAARMKGDHRRCIAIGNMMARLGELLQRGKNNNQLASYGSQLKSEAWGLAKESTRRSSLQSRDFALYAASHGRADVARMVPKWAARQWQVALAQKNWHDAQWRAGWWRDAGAILIVNGLYMGVFWLVANLFLWRGQGAPSTQRERLWPAVAIALFSLAVAWWPIRFFANVDSGRWTPTRMHSEIAAGSLGFLAFFGPPFLMAVLCAGLTLWRQKGQFLRSTRLEVELRLNPFENTLMKSGTTMLCALSLLGTLGCWVVWLVLLKAGVFTFDLLSWLPQNSQGIPWTLPVPLEAMAAPLGYFLFLNLLGFLLWFIKWRYFSGHENRALTHGALRCWKEALGVYVGLVSITYLGAGLCGWPVRAAANRELESRMQFGELPR